MRARYLFVVMAFAVLLVSCGKQERPAVVVDEPVVPNRPVQQLREGYAGAESCKACHTHQHATWFDSYHRTMTTEAGPETVLGNFDNQLAEANGRQYIMERIGDEFWVEEDPGDEAVRRKVVMITGSHHMQVYWYAKDHLRGLGMVPVVWLNKQERWIPRRSAFLNPPTLADAPDYFQWSYSCIKCHTTAGNPGLIWQDGFDPAEFPVEVETHASEFGISCEACHGPGAEHVALQQAATEEEPVDDELMVLPTELDGIRSSQVCGQCHSIRLMSTPESHSAYFTNGYDFCAGMTLEESGQYLWRGEVPEEHPAHNRIVTDAPENVRGYFWRDGMVRVSGREYNGLVESPCYAHGDPAKQMSCMDCHQLHQEKSDTRDRAVWADDQLNVGGRDGSACVGCHSGFDNSEHTFHAAESSGSNCLNCHMPHTTYGLLKGIRSHTISSPSVQETVEVGRPNACNLCHLDKSLGWTADHLAQWYGIEKPLLSEDERGVPAALILMYSGDASLRALTAHAMGWEPAREVSGSDWLAKPLIDLLLDEYDAVRFIAERSLRKDARYQGIPYDFMDPPLQRQMAYTKMKEVAPDALNAWKTLLDHERGDVATNVIYRLSLSRDGQDIFLLE